MNISSKFYLRRTMSLIIDAMKLQLIELKKGGKYIIAFY